MGFLYLRWPARRVPGISRGFNPPLRPFQSRPHNSVSSRVQDTSNQFLDSRVRVVVAADPPTEPLPPLSLEHTRIRLSLQEANACAIHPKVGPRQIERALGTDTNYRGLSPDAEAVMKEGEQLQILYTLEARIDHQGSRAQSVARQILDQVPKDHKLRAKAIDLAGQLLVTHYMHEEDCSDLKKAIECYEEFLDLHPQGSKGRNAALIKRAKTLLLDFEHKGHTATLSSAALLVTRALELSAKGSTERFDALLLGAQIAKTRSKSAEDAPSSQLDEAIALETEVLNDGQALFRPIASHAAALNALGVSLRMRYQLSQGASVFDIQNSMRHQQESLSRLPSTASIAKGETLLGLANTLLVHYKAGDNASNLETSISYLKEAVSMFDCIPHLQRTAESDLASALSIRYDIDKTRTDDLYKAVYSQRHALDLCPEDHKDLEKHLHQLGLLLEKQYAQSRGISDLTDTMDVWRRLRKRSSPGSEFRRIGSRRLADSIEKRYQEYPTESHLQELIDLRTELVETASDDDPDFSKDLVSLQRALDHGQFAHDVANTENPQSPIVANSMITTTIGEPAMAPSFPPLPAPVTHSQSTQVPTDLASQSRFPYTPGSLGLTPRSPAALLYIHDPSNITNVIGDYRQRLAITPDGHPDRVQNIKCLAEALRIRFGQNGGRSDLEESDWLMQNARSHAF